jgi:hypothetical protein
MFARLLLAILLIAPTMLSSPVADERLHVAQAAPDEMAWGLVRDSADPLVLERFLAQFPDSTHAQEARDKLRALEDQGGQLEAPTAAPIQQPVVAPTSYALDVQRELKRVGCYTGKLDGAWGPGSRRALSNFASAAGVRVGNQPNAEVLAVVRAKSTTVCTRPTASPEPAPPTGGQSAGCYNVGVTVDSFNQSGQDWDPWAGNRAKPDPMITELTTGTKKTCSDSFTCSMQVNGAGSTLSFNIVDDDPDRDDPIGTGQCRGTGSCRVGSATLSITRC